MTVQETHHSDQVFKNGAVYTVNPKRPWARTVAVRNGEIVCVGDDQDVKTLIGPRTQVIDLQGKMMLPGFHDVHVHLFDGGMQSLQCDLWDCQTADEVIDSIKTHINDQARGQQEWIQCVGLQKTCTADLNCRLLDTWLPEQPLYIRTFDGHSCLVNTRALEIAGIDRDTSDPPGGRIERMPGSSQPNGYLHDFAARLITDAMPAPAMEQRVAGLQKGIAAAHRFGITSIIEPGVDDALAAPYHALSRRNALNLRVRASISPINWQPGAFGEDIFEFVTTRERLQRPGIDVESVKVYIDGVLENGSAVLLEPYSDPNLRGGAPFYSQEDLNRYITWIDGQDLQVHLHAIGDGGVRMALDAFEAALKENGQKDNRHHICHVQMIDPQDVPRFAALNVTANFQPLWAFPDPYVTDTGLSAVGPDRLEKFYVIGSVHHSGGRVACGSDWFVSSLNPLDAMAVGVRRQDPHLPEGAPQLNPGEAVDLATMIEGYTIHGAYLMHQEDLVGSIETGKRADLIVLDRNVFDVPAAEINQAKVLLTLFDGQAVYKSNALPGLPLSAC
jgi:predicted amidohydrolase YtcJ